MKRKITINATTKELMAILERLAKKYGGDKKLSEVIKAEYNKDEVVLY